MPDGRHSAVCSTCGKDIFRYVNRRPFSPWMHKDSNLAGCWRNGKYDSSEKAAPERGKFSI